MANKRGFSIRGGKNGSKKRRVPHRGVVERVAGADREGRKPMVGPLLLGDIPAFNVAAAITQSRLI